jgi:hypothetical protein
MILQGRTNGLVGPLHKSGREPLLVRRAGSRDKPARLADSWRRCLLASLANALSHVAARHCLLALSASAFSCAAA